MQLIENHLLFKPLSLRVCTEKEGRERSAPGKNSPIEMVEQENHFYFSKAVAPKPFPVLILPPMAHFCGHVQGERTAGPLSLYVEMMKLAFIVVEILFE